VVLINKGVATQMRILIGLVGTAALIVAAAVVFVRAMGADVVITNTGASGVQVRGSIPAAAESAMLAAGINIPAELRPGVPTLVRVPRLGGVVSANAGAIDLSMLGQTMHITATCDRLDLDGSTLLGHSTSFDFASGGRHDVSFACR
jgi:hypothetical protein